MGKQTDWGGSVAKVTREQVKEMLRLCHPAGDALTNEASLAREVEGLNRLVFGKQYALVVREEI